jgi:hypothetical protein
VGRHLAGGQVLEGNLKVVEVLREIEKIVEVPVERIIVEERVV